MSMTANHDIIISSHVSSLLASPPERFPHQPQKCRHPMLRRPCCPWRDVHWRVFCPLELRDPLPLIHCTRRLLSSCQSECCLGPLCRVLPGCWRGCVQPLCPGGWGSLLQILWSPVRHHGKHRTSWNLRRFHHPPSSRPIVVHSSHPCRCRSACRWSHHHCAVRKGSNLFLEPPTF